MYYHCRELKYVQYGKVYPPPEEKVDQDNRPAYEWLGKYCGFFPQIWLSISRSAITGIRYGSSTSILFGFEHVRGFPLRYDRWEYLLNPLSTGIVDSAALQRYYTEMLTETQAALEPGEQLGDFLEEWQQSNGLDDFLHRYVFIKQDQVVVPSLNLKSAKEIICRNERQKRQLRKMGFIEDRIMTQNRIGKYYGEEKNI